MVGIRTVIVAGILAVVILSIIAYQIKTGSRPDPYALAVDPRKARRRHRWLGGLIVLWHLFLALSHLQRNQTTIALSYSVFILMWIFAWYEWVHRPVSDKESLANYRNNSRICGRCDYDLTGNMSGVCPECGWNIPK